MSDYNDNDDSSRVEELDMDGTPKAKQKKKVLSDGYNRPLPATAASSERSIAGLIISAKQASLDPSTVTDFLFYVRIGNMCSHHKIDSLASS